MNWEGQIFGFNIRKVDKKKSIFGMPTQWGKYWIGQLKGSIRGRLKEWGRFCGKLTWGQ